MTTTPDPPHDTLPSDTQTQPVNAPRIEQPASGAPHDDPAAGENEDALLGRVCQLLVTALPVAAAAMALVDEQLNLTAAAASPRDMHTMIAAQFEHGHGPCLDACRTGQPVVETDIAASRHWATATGWRAVHTLPVRIDRRTAAVATLASARDNGLTPAQISTAHSITTTAAAHASTMRALRGSQQLATQLQHALYGRVEIEQAKGIVAHQLGVTVNEALAILHRHAHNQGQHLADTAYQVVAGNLRLRRQDKEEETDIVIARGHTDTPATPEHPEHPADAKDARIGLGRPRNLLSIVRTGNPRSARLIGEADLSTEDHLAHALERLATQPGDITLDVGDLTLIDARSIGLLVRAATALPPPDRLVLRHTTGIVAKVLALLDISDHPRILIT